MTKRIISFVCAIAIIAGIMQFGALTAFAETTRSYELWTQSPNITSGITDDELRIYKAMNLNTFSVVPLTQLGINYYLAICEGQTTTGGWSGKTNTSELYYYTILMTNDSFIILSKARVNNEYYWSRGNNIADISSQINSSYYTSNGYEVPCYIVNPNGKYTNSNMNEYDDYIFITKNGTLYSTPEDSEDGCEGYPFIYNGILYRGQERYYSSSRYYYYYLADGSTKAVQYAPYQFKNGSITYGTNNKVEVTSVTAENGYTLYREGFASNTFEATYYKIPNANSLYMSVTQPYTYNSSAGRYYYYQQVEIYSCNNGMMSLSNSKLIPTTNTYAQSITIKTLGNLDNSFYTSKGYSPPQIIINKNIVVTQDGTIGTMSLNPEIYSTYWEWAGYNNRLTVIRNRDSGSYLYWAENGTYSYWQKLNYVYFDINGTMILEPDISLKVVSGGNSGQNGYYYGYSTYNAPSFSNLSYASTQTWFGRNRSNVFPDGRKVTARWMGMGGGLYELWYEILKPDATLLSTGPTGYSTSFGSVFDTYDLITFAVNNSKFIVSLNMVQRDWSVEYYRVAVVEESETGEITGNGQLGEKNITPPDEADTEIIQPSIDFAQNDLPIGYNIKNNVIDSGKLDSSLRQQVNTIRLNDIVILKKSGYISGSQNTGTPLTYYSTYDYSLGSSYIRLYTNGQNFYWYCYNPENLTAGTYNKTLYSGDKTIYVTMKVIAPPSNSGVTSVTF